MAGRSFGFERHCFECASYFQVGSHEAAEDVAELQPTTSEQEPRVERRSANRPWQAHKSNEPPASDAGGKEVQRAAGSDEVWEEF